MRRKLFLEKCINKYINKESKVIVFGGGQMENEILVKNYFANVTFLNIGEQDLENVNYNKIIQSMNENNIKDNEYDYAIVNASIHHSSKPHYSILEMYRVAKKGVLIVEGNDSLTIRLSAEFGIAEKFEKSAIENGQGGVDNSEIPNFIYRWTEREILKLINSYKPELIHKIIFDYGYDLGNVLKKKNFVRKIIEIIFKVYFNIFKKQQNLLSIFIDKQNSKKRNF